MEHHSTISNDQTYESNSGIYAISGVNTDACYVGSSTNLQRREREQFCALEYQRHYNRNLQSAYDDLGRSRIKFLVLEYVDATELAEKEQDWINHLSKEGSLFNIYLVVPRNRPGGHKLSDETRRRQRHAKRGRKIPIEKTRARLYRFLTPEGEEVETLGLRALAERHGLNVSHLSKVARGKLKEHRGFKRLQVPKILPQTADPPA